MKMYNKFIVIFAVALGFCVASCDDGDAIVDQVVADTERGAVLRTVSVLENEVLFNTSTNAIQGGGFSVILEEQDSENGGLLSEVEVYVGFRDNTVSPGGPDNDKDEVFYETIPGSAFSPGEFGLPRYEFSVSAAEIQTALGITGDQIFGGDQFTIRFELVLTDGRRFSFADNSGTLTGSFFASPFLYTANIVCAPTPPTPGDWVIDMQDSYGDGWNGASLLFTLDGEETNISITSGSEGTEIFTVPEGAQVLSIEFVSGDWDSEITFQVTSANGNEILDLGPSPTAGAELINYCLGNI